MRVTGGSTPSGAFVTAAISNINFNNANAAGNGCTIGLSNQLVTMTNNRCFGDTALKYEGPGGSVSLGVSAYHGASSGVSASGLIGTFVGGSLNFSNTLMYASAGPAFSARNVSMLGMSGTSGWTAQTNSASAQSGAFAFSGIASRTSSGSGVPVLKCLQAGPAGIIHLNNTTSSTTPPTFLTYDNMYVDGCTTGIDLSQGSGNALVTISSALTCNNNTTCINVASGSRFRVPGTWTLTGVTNDITIDAVNYTKLNLTSAVPPRLPLAATNIGSSVWQ